MESVNINESEKLDQFSYVHLTKVTSLSKYHAATLFIIMPFVGAWIGYQYGVSVKEVEVVTITPRSMPPVQATNSFADIYPHFELATVTPGVEGEEPPTHKITLIDKNGSTILQESEQNCSILTDENAKNSTAFEKNITVDGVTYDTRDVINLVSCGWAGWFVTYALYQVSSLYPVTVLLSGGEETQATEARKVYPK